MIACQRLMHFAAAGALAVRRCGPPCIWPLSLRSIGRPGASAWVRRCEPAASGVASPAVAYAKVAVPEAEGVFISEGLVSRLPPNQWLERTAGQRCWPVPFALCASAAAQPQRWAVTLAQRSCTSSSTPSVAGADRQDRFRRVDAFCRCWCFHQRSVGPHAFDRSLFASTEDRVCTDESVVAKRSCPGRPIRRGLASSSSCSHVRGVVFSEAEAVFVSEGVLSGLPPNKRLNRTAHQRCWWVPVALCAPAAG